MGEDLLVAEAALTLSLASYGSASFHAQQAAEKALKALLTRHGVEFGKTHSIEELLQLGESVAPGLLDRLADAGKLTPYAVRTRYPGEGPLPDREQAAGHLTLARRVVDEVRILLGPYLDAGPPAA